MTTAMDHGALDRARSFMCQRLAQMDKQDRAVVIELMQTIGSEGCDEPDEVLEAIAELLFPESLATTLEPDDTDVTTKTRVEAYRRMVGQTIRSLRQAKGMTQNDLSKATNLPQSHISQLEHGRHTPTYVTIERLARALGTTADQIDPGFDDYSN